MRGVSETDTPATRTDSIGRTRPTSYATRKPVELAVKEFGGLSSRAIAELCGVSDPFVGQIREALQPVSNATRTTSDGRQYPATRRASGPTTPEEEEARTYGDVRRRQPRRRDGVREVVGVRHGRGLDTGAGVRIL